MVMVKVRKQTSQLSGSRKKLIVGCALWIALLSMAGCDASSSGPRISSGGDMRTEKLKTNLTAEEARELAQPITNTPGLSVETGAAQNVAIGNETYESQMNPAMGLKTRRLFADRAESDDERFERLEAAVQALRDDFDKASPSINRLMAIEQEIQTLVDQLQVLTGDNTAMAEVPVPPVPAEMLEDEGPTTMPPLPADALAAQDAQSATAPPQPIAPAAMPAPAAAPPPEASPPAVPPPAPVATPAPAATGTGLVAVRVGDHEGSTRIVFETAEKLSYTADLDSEKILVVTFLSGTSGLSAVTAPKSDLVKSVDITPQDKGFVAAMSLAKTSKIIRQGVLPPDAQNPNYRIYIDLQR